MDQDIDNIFEEIDVMISKCILDIESSKYMDN